uniref:Highly divergent homeobox-like n=1 Tax=Sinocyclocheilus grahami TaxID=75366 RepID=A0A672PEZ9_SINGR
MEKWLEKRSIHTMNLRSVFSAEQQRILERYYECGMINQSKSCFQLILQCAQETKLDFSVVRTWVGNKRRKLASKADQNGAGAQALSHQHVSCGSAGVLIAGSVLSTEIAAMRSIQRGPPVTHLLPPQASSSSSSSSSSSPLSDVILTGIYANCFDATVHNRTVTKSLPSHAEMEPPAVQQKSPIIPGGSSALKCSQTLKPFPSRDVIAPSWAPQSRAEQHASWPQKTAAAHRAPAGAGAQIKHVFTRAGLERPPDAARKTRPVEASEVFSIAMETADAEDEYSREEELANMAAQMQCGKASSSLTVSPGLNPSNSALFGEKGCQTSSSLLSRTSSPGSLPLKLLSQTSATIPCLKVSDMSAPWLHSNSRKRTLQDRTQFSDRDVYTLKRYWDKGMTSLGSLCKEKISAAACELSVDTEIIKTWIGNRRRKYRLMGIEIPPPKGGPAMFPNHSPHILEDERQTPELGEASEHNDLMSLCLSDGGDDFHAVDKIEIVDEEEDDDDGDMLTTEMEQMQNLLEFRVSRESRAA